MSIHTWSVESDTMQTKTYFLQKIDTNHEHLSMDIFGSKVYPELFEHYTKKKEHLEKAHKDLHSTRKDLDQKLRQNNITIDEYFVALDKLLI